MVSTVYMIVGSVAPETRAVSRHVFGLTSSKHRTAHDTGVLRNGGNPNDQHEIGQTGTENRHQYQWQQDAWEGEQDVRATYDDRICIPTEVACDPPEKDVDNRDDTVTTITGI